MGYPCGVGSAGWCFRLRRFRLHQKRRHYKAFSPCGSTSQGRQPENPFASFANKSLDKQHIALACSTIERTRHPPFGSLKMKTRGANLFSIFSVT